MKYFNFPEAISELISFFPNLKLKGKSEEVLKYNSGSLTMSELHS